jgi:hypothetical protein
MRAFSFDRRVVNQYEAFSRSFTRIRAPDLKAAVEHASSSGRFWPDPLLSINPAYEQGATADALAAQKWILPETADVFRLAGAPLTFHAHQEQAISKAASQRSFVVTTGTGSGKSLCFFVPIIDAAIQARKAGAPAGTRAIIVYPMNALANSQQEEIAKFLDQSGLAEQLKPSVARYTGQESSEQRHDVARNPPDILLTNFMMLELLMTRQDEVDCAVINNAKGLEFVVLDELHTYRGRQGADVAVLVRRLKDRCRGQSDPICIGTSATMASEGNEDKRSESVADVSSRLFGDRLGSDAVIDERLQRVTNPSKRLDNIGSDLKAALNSPLPDQLPDAALRDHPLAVWLELEVGLDDSKGLHRRKPVPIGEAAVASRFPGPLMKRRSWTKRAATWRAISRRANPRATHSVSRGQSKATPKTGSSSAAVARNSVRIDGNPSHFPSISVRMVGSMITAGHFGLCPANLAFVWRVTISQARRRASATRLAA